MIRHLLCIILLASATAAEAGEDIFAYMGQRYGVDPWLLKAVSWQESRWHPWTVNMAGESFYFDSKKAAISMIEKSYRNPWLLVMTMKNGKIDRQLMSTEALAKRRGRSMDVKSFKIIQVPPGRFDVGLMQIHWHFHGKGVPSLSRLFDPDYNVAYGARFLSDLIREHGMSKAIGYYHSRDTERRTRYTASVLGWYRAMTSQASAATAMRAGG